MSKKESIYFYKRINPKKYWGSDNITHLDDFEDTTLKVFRGDILYLKNGIRDTYANYEIVDIVRNATKDWINTKVFNKTNNLISSKDSRIGGTFVLCDFYKRQ